MKNSAKQVIQTYKGESKSSSSPASHDTTVLIFGQNEIRGSSKRVGVKKCDEMSCFILPAKSALKSTI